MKGTQFSSPEKGRKDVGMSFRAVCSMNWPVGIKQLEWVGRTGVEVPETKINSIDIRPNMCMCK